MAEAITKTLEERIVELELQMSELTEFVDVLKGWKSNKVARTTSTFTEYLNTNLRVRSRPSSPASTEVLKAEQFGGKSTNTSKSIDEELEAKVGRKIKSSITTAKRGSKPGSKKNSKPGSKKSSKRGSKKNTKTKTKAK